MKWQLTCALWRWLIFSSSSSGNFPPFLTNKAHFWSIGSGTCKYARTCVNNQAHVWTTNLHCSIQDLIYRKTYTTTTTAAATTITTTTTSTTFLLLVPPPLLLLLLLWPFGTRVWKSNYLIKGLQSLNSIRQLTIIIFPQEDIFKPFCFDGSS